MFKVLRLLQENSKSFDLLSSLGLDLGIYKCNLSFLQSSNFFFIIPPFWLFTYEHRTTNEEDQASNKPEFFGLVEENTVTSTWKASSNIALCLTHVFLRGTTGSKRATIRWKVILGPSISRNEDKIKRVRQVVCYDRQLTVWMITSPLERKKESFRMVTI